MRRVVVTAPLVRALHVSSTLRQAPPISQITVRVVRETLAGERRCAASPETTAELLKRGFRGVEVEEGAGVASSLPDSLFVAAGAKVVAPGSPAPGPRVVLKVQPPTLEEAAGYEGATLLSYVYPAKSPELLSALASKHVSALALDQVPRTTIGQQYDALSSQANIAGYRAVVEAAHLFGRFLGGQMTAAGKVAPAKVLIIGGGVAGLSAAATARNLGAVVKIFDTRAAVREQAESLGAEFLEVAVKESGEGVGGYAREMSDAYKAAQAELFAKQARLCDIIISTALIPGRPAPKLVTTEMVDSMRPGSVVMDLAAEAGGNCTVTVPGKAVLHKGSVWVAGYTDLPSRLPAQASALLARTTHRLLLLAVAKDNTLAPLRPDDDVLTKTLVTHAGRVLWKAPAPLPPPPPPPDAATVKRAEDAARAKADADAAAAVAAAAAAVKAADAASYSATLKQALTTLGGGVAAITLGALAPNLEVASMLGVLALSTVIGNYVVFGVAPALHSPLMSVTNAVSGMTAVGGMMLCGGGYLPDTASQVLGAGAVLVSAVNIGGGFTMTGRMLDMFKRKTDATEYGKLWLLPGVGIPATYLAALGAGMGSPALHSAAGLAASAACIGALAGLSSQTTARMGNALGQVGVGTACVATLGIMAPHVEASTLWQMGGLLLTGGVVGQQISSRIPITDLPQLVAAFHSFVGAAAVATAFSSFLAPIAGAAESLTGGHDKLHLTAEWAGNAIGALGACCWGTSPATAFLVLGDWTATLRPRCCLRSLNPHSPPSPLRRCHLHGVARGVW